MTTEDSFYIALNEFDNNIRTIWRTVQSEGDFCDMTLAHEDMLIQTHKVIMSSMSFLEIGKELKTDGFFCRKK